MSPQYFFVCDFRNFFRSILFNCGIINPSHFMGFPCQVCTTRVVRWIGSRPWSFSPWLTKNQPALASSIHARKVPARTIWSPNLSPNSWNNSTDDVTQKLSISGCSLKYRKRAFGLPENLWPLSEPKQIKLSETASKPNNRIVYTLSIWADFYLDINVINNH